MTATLHARVAGEIEIPMAQLQALPQYEGVPSVLDQIKASLAFVNEDKQKLLDEKIFSARDMPDTLDMWKEVYRRGGEHMLLIPRGFASSLIAGCNAAGVSISFDDQRSKALAQPGYFSQFPARDYQFAAVMALLQQQQGMYKSPAGSGKTVTMLCAAAHTGMRTLIIVDKESLLEQWRTRAATFGRFEFESVLDEETGRETKRAILTKRGDPKLREIGKIGNGVWEERDLTIALRQSLFARDHELEPLQWYREWGVTIFDEAHHLSADTMQETCRHMTSFYLWGTSATPAKSETRGKIVYSLVGPIIHETPRRILRERGILMTSKVRSITTDFNGLFWPTHDFIPGKDPNTGEARKCVVPDCTKKNGHQHRNNWSSVLKALIEDPERNKFIAETICASPKGVHLVATGQKKQIALLKKALKEAGWKGKVHTLTGEENAKGLSQGIAQEIEDDARKKGPDSLGHVILSTVAEEGLDIPPIDHVHMTFPRRQEAAIEQVAGRGERQWPGKLESWIIDYRDSGCTVFESQYMVRESVYNYMGYPITYETTTDRKIPTDPAPF